MMSKSLFLLALALFCQVSAQNGGTLEGIYGTFANMAADYGIDIGAQGRPFGQIGFALGGRPGRYQTTLGLASQISRYPAMAASTALDAASKLVAQIAQLPSNGASLTVGGRPGNGGRPGGNMGVGFGAGARPGGSMGLGFGAGGRPGGNMGLGFGAGGRPGAGAHAGYGMNIGLGANGRPGAGIHANYGFGAGATPGGEVGANVDYQMGLADRPSSGFQVGYEVGVGGRPGSGVGGNIGGGLGAHAGYGASLGGRPGSGAQVGQEASVQVAGQPVAGVAGRPATTGSQNVFENTSNTDPATEADGSVVLKPLSA